MLFTIPAWTISILLKAFSVWFFATALMFWKKSRAFTRRAPKTRFACLIPARNEEAVIADLVKSLREQNYPDEMYDIYVIPNNCTDGTEIEAMAAGAKILRCRGRIRCKGDVLQEAVSWLIDRRRKDGGQSDGEQAREMDGQAGDGWLRRAGGRSDWAYDAFCLFDADNVVHPDFLARMNDAVAAGAKVAKGRQRVKNPRSSWVSGCYALYFAMNDTFFSRSRSHLGLSAKLVGTGMMVHRSVLEKMGGWNTTTIAEDAEFAAQCAELGQRVWWVPEAVTFDEAPLSFAVSLTQRKRWCSGIMSTAEKMVPRLLHFTAEASTRRIVDMCFFLCTPFAQAFSVLPGLLFFLGAMTQGTVKTWAGFAGAFLILSIIAMTAFAFWLRWLSHQEIHSASVFLFPLFMASFIPLQILSLLNRTTEWKVIRHGESVGAI